MKIIVEFSQRDNLMGMAVELIAEENKEVSIDANIEGIDESKWREQVGMFGNICRMMLEKEEVTK